MLNNINSCKNFSSIEEFKIFIESIGFKHIGNNCYEYKDCKITANITYYNFFNGIRWDIYEYSENHPFDEYFKNELRSIKFKKILG